MTDSILKPWEKTIRITILENAVDVPENNLLLRCLQYMLPETVPYGRFCWNDECGNSEFRYLLPGDPEERVERACRFVPVADMEITAVSDQLRQVLAPLFSTDS
ncbi:MAG: hypothetical protein IFK94_13075 [Acidobacteria bacterium]|uniref:Uncharacterized protein n=1 Tax=Candidatus Polarisedimenticola svalbardensis TaxID=2886004 RepID=A0A8J6Y470_9BACT|nr:hypothetical protein [Candidatus Polarisedimenticola svalbardensis]